MLLSYFLLGQFLSLCWKRLSWRKNSKEKSDIDFYSILGIVLCIWTKNQFFRSDFLGMIAMTVSSLLNAVRWLLSKKKFWNILNTKWSFTRISLALLFSCLLFLLTFPRPPSCNHLLQRLCHSNRSYRFAFYFSALNKIRFQPLHFYRILSLSVRWYWAYSVSWEISWNMALEGYWLLPRPWYWNRENRKRF